MKPSKKVSRRLDARIKAFERMSEKDKVGHTRPGSRQNRSR
jgi:hypothetical protein